MAEATNKYIFTNTWFDANKEVWRELLQTLTPRYILEIGCYEGKSTTYLIEMLASQHEIEIHCIDSWEGGSEHKQGGFAEANMKAVSERFAHNIRIARQKAKHQVNLIIHKGLSCRQLPKLLNEGKHDYFDFIYIDASHQAPDVLLDAILSFELLKPQGVLAFDDYLWHEPLPGGVDPIRCPKIAIDAFTTIYCRKLRVIPAPLNQLYIQKLSEE